MLIFQLLTSQDELDEDVDTVLRLQKEHLEAERAHQVALIAVRFHLAIFQNLPLTTIPAGTIVDTDPLCPTVDHSDSDGARFIFFVGSKQP